MIYNENKEIHTTDNNKPKKVLDVTWNNKTDTLIYNFLDLIKEAKLLKPTKRNVLKILSSFYEPMGLIQPIIIGLKILVQNIWKKYGKIRLGRNVCTEIIRGLAQLFDKF